MSVHLSDSPVLQSDSLDQHKLGILEYPSANSENDHQELLTKIIMSLIQFDSLHC